MPAIAPHTQAQPIADGVYVLRGTDDAPAPSNLARIANVGVIVGATGVAVIGTGVSYRDGIAIQAAVASVTAQPIRFAVITQPQQQYLMGAAAFQERGIPVWMHRDAATLMQSRCAICLKNLRELLGDAAMQGTRIIERPDRLLDADVVDDTIGRPLRLLASERSSAPGDLAVLDEKSGTLFAGDAVTVDRVPDLRDADVIQWPPFLARLSATHCRTLVAGRGAARTCAAIPAVGGYIAALDNKVRAALERGVGLGELPQHIDLPAFSRWAQYDSLHRPNAQRLYLWHERQMLDAASRRGSGPLSP